MAIQGVSPTIIGKALGHRSQASTAMYARLTQDPVRQAMIRAQEALAMPQSSIPTVVLFEDKGPVHPELYNEKTS